MPGTFPGFGHSILFCDGQALHFLSNSVSARHLQAASLNSLTPRILYKQSKIQAVIASEAKQSPPSKQEIASAQKARLAMTPLVGLRRSFAGQLPCKILSCKDSM